MDIFDLWFLPSLAASGTIFIAGSMFRVDGDVPARLSWLGMAAVFSWINIMRYLQFYDKYNVLLTTLRRGVPHIVRYMVGVLPVLIAYSLIGTCLFWRSVSYTSVSQTFMSLFAFMNGDEIHDCFLDVDEMTGVLGQAYMYSFGCIFIFVVLNVMITIMEEAFFTARFGDKPTEGQEVTNSDSWFDVAGTPVEDDVFPAEVNLTPGTSNVSGNPMGEPLLSLSRIQSPRSSSANFTPVPGEGISRRLTRDLNLVLESAFPEDSMRDSLGPRARSPERSDAASRGHSPVFTASRRGSPVDLDMQMISLEEGTDEFTTKPAPNVTDRSNVTNGSSAAAVRQRNGEPQRSREHTFDRSRERQSRERQRSAERERQRSAERTPIKQSESKESLTDRYSTERTPTMTSATARLDKRAKKLKKNLKNISGI